MASISKSQEDVAALQQLVFSLAQHVNRTQGIPPQTANHVSTELRSLSTQLNEIIRSLVENVRTISADRDTLALNVQAKQRLIQNALAERDRACGERDQASHEINLFRTQLENLHDRQRQADDRMAEIETTYQASIQDLREKVQFQEEQLAGKRSLWLDHHPSSAARHTGGQHTRGPFETPTGSGRPGPSPPKSDLKPTNLTAQFESMSLASSQGVTDLPTGAARPSQQIWSTNSFNSSKHNSRANAGSDTPPKAEIETQAIVPFQTLEQIAADFRLAFNSIFQNVEKWAFSYSHKLPDMSSDQKLSHNQQYWSYLMKCAFVYKSNVHEAHNHTILLLRHTDSRAWFIMRVFVQYLIDEVLTAKNWAKFDDGYDMDLQDIESRLKEVLSVQERGDLVTKRSNIVSSIYKSPKYSAYRNYFLGKHTSNLRSKLGPLLDIGVQRADAGRDIGVIVVQAYDLSAKMLMSFKTFVVMFPECGARFIDSSMDCRDSKIPDGNTLQLQIKQHRVKLAMSPVITLRDDRVRSIDVKAVQEADVLTMK